MFHDKYRGRIWIKCGLVLDNIFEDEPVLNNYTYHIIYYLHINGTYCIVVNDILISEISVSSTEGI
jgi:hypothetical protein